MATSQTSPHTISPLLNLPSELRLSIYALLITPYFLAVPPSNYTGLLLSCKYIYQEMELEAIKSIRAFLATLQTLSRCTIQPQPQHESTASLGTWRHLVVYFPTTVTEDIRLWLLFARFELSFTSSIPHLRPIGPERRKLPFVLLVLLRLHLTSLTVNIENKHHFKFHFICFKYLTPLFQFCTQTISHPRGDRIIDTSEEPRCTRVVFNVNNWMLANTLKWGENKDVTVTNAAWISIVETEENRTLSGSAKRSARRIVWTRNKRLDRA